MLNNKTKKQNTALKKNQSEQGIWNSSISLELALRFVLNILNQTFYEIDPLNINQLIN